MLAPVWLGQPSVALLAFVGRSCRAEQAAVSSAAERVPPLEPVRRSRLRDAGIMQKIPSKAVPGKGNTNLGAPWS